MLDRESDEHERGSDKERRIERKRHRTYGLRQQSPVSEIVNGRHRRQYVGRSNAAAERKYGRPGEPIAPDREGGDDLAVSYPGGRAVYRCASGLVGEQPGNFGIGERLDEPHRYRQRPDQKAELPDRYGDLADGTQHQR